MSAAAPETSDLTREEGRAARARAFRLMGRTLAPRWRLLVAAAVLSILPILLVFLIFQRRFVHAMTESALK